MFYVNVLWVECRRDISNTRMIIEGVRKGRTSVEEEVQRIIHPELRCDTSKFISAGTGSCAKRGDEGVDVGKYKPNST